LVQSDPLASREQSHRPEPGAFICCSVRIDAVTVEDAIDRVLSGKARGAVHLCNAYTLSLASKDKSLASQLNQGSLNVADGKPVVWVARHLGFKHMERRVYGPELMARTIDEGQVRGTRHFLYGSTPEVIEALSGEVARRWPEAQMVGAESPPFGELSDAELDAAARRFEAADAQIVWVGLGTPKQDVVTARLAERSGLTFVAIGAAFDFIAGEKKQAPRFMQEHGLEWLFRLASEPRRLWKRYLIGNTGFLRSVVRTHPARIADSR
jgi:N-acetylglucosaminyldiphosphoundecaprenol N-acetyl-beta-D-mannosaminyltransferase